VEYVYRHHADYDLVWCVNGEQPASLLADLAALASQLGLAADASQEAQVAALRGWFERHQHWLLVLLAPEEVLVGVAAAVLVGRSGAWLADHPATTVMRCRL
jgi:hypothetical protein